MEWAEALEKQLAFYRDNVAEAYHNLAISYELNDEGTRYGAGFDLDRAISAWGKSLEYKPDNSDRLWNKAVAYINGGKVDEGVPVLREWIKKTGQNTIAQTFYTNGFVAFEKGDPAVKAAIR